MPGPGKRLTVEERAAKVIRYYESAQSLRGNWETHWDEIARRILPHYSGLFVERGIMRSQGEKRNQDMVDATGAAALPKFASVMESMLTPRNQIWHRLVAKDRVLRTNKSVRDWMDETRDLLFDYRYGERANYAAQQHESYMSLGAFGTGALYIDKLRGRGERGLRYRNIHLGEIFFLENFQGQIDTALRKFPLTARQAVQMFSEPGDQLPAKIAEKARDTKECETQFFFIHCVRPRSDEDGYDPERLDKDGMAFTAEYVSCDERVIVRDSGHNTFPYAISRYVQAPGETYGRSPAMIALPSIKTLNEQKKTVLKQGHRAVDPVLLAHDDGVISELNLLPGAVNFGAISADGKRLVMPLETGRLDLAKDMMDEERAIIQDVFLINLFQILVETPRMTATEVLERTREKGILLAPTMGRQQSEALGPMIERELDVLAEQGIIPPMPEILRQAAGEYKPEYDSPLSRAARAEEAAGLFRTVGTLGEYIAISQDPSPLDWVDWDEAVPAILDIQAVPSRWIRSLEAVQEIRAARAQQAEMKQAIEAAPSAAAVLKATGGAMPKGQ